MNKYQDFIGKVKGKELQAVIIFADIMDASEISSNVSIKKYAYTLNQFHECVASVIKFIGLGNYQNNVVELSSRGDEFCAILHSLPLRKGSETETDIEESLKKDISDSILLAIAIKLLWRASPYNQERIHQDLFPRDIGIGIHQGPVFFYKNPNLACPLDKTESSEGYSINLAKRIETESRNGTASKIFVSGSYKYWTDKIQVPIIYKRSIIPEKLKGFSAMFSLYEIETILEKFYGFIEKLLAEINFDNRIWAKYQLLKEKIPDDFWTNLLFDFKSLEKKKSVETFNDDLLKELELLETQVRDVENISEPNEDSCYKEAEKYSNMANYEDAIKYYTKSIELGKDDILVYWGRGNAYYYQKKYDEAIKDFSKALEINPKNKKLLVRIGIIYRKNRSLNESILYINKAIELDNKKAEYYHELGLSYFIMGNYNKAKEKYIEAISIGPVNSRLLNNTGYCFFDLDEYDSSIDYFQQSIEKDESQKDAYCGLAISYLRKNLIDDAQKYFLHAISLDSKYAGQITELMNEGYYYSEKELTAINEILNQVKSKGLIK